MMVVDEDGTALDPQPTSVKEGDTIMVVVTVVDKDDTTIEAAEKLTVELMPTGTADSADYTVVGSSDIDMGMRDERCHRNRGAVGRGCRHGIAHVRRRGDR